MTRAAYWIGTWFGCGFWPKGPGTAGAVGALLFILLVSGGKGWTPVQCGIASAVLFLPSVWAAQAVARDRETKDPQIVVVDEVIGTWIALMGAREWNWTNVLLAFGLFRLFDIFKPPPVRQLERVPGGWGIILDDVMAGIYGALVLWGWGWFNRG